MKSFLASMVLAAVSTSWAIPADPGPVVKLPAEATAKPGRVLRLSAETTGTTVKWAIASDEADLIPLDAEGKSAIFTTPTPGKYLVLAWTAKGDVPSDVARCWVTVLGDPPRPPVPPTPPGPVDQLTSDLATLYVADPSPTKATDAKQLAAVYREAVGFVDRADVATVVDLANRVKAAAASLVPATSLVPLRKRVAEEVAKVLTFDGPLTPESRAAAKAAFGRIAAALEALK